MIITNVEIQSEEFNIQSNFLPELTVTVTMRVTDSQEGIRLINAVGTEISITEIKKREFALFVFTKEEI